MGYPVIVVVARTSPEEPQGLVLRAELIAREHERELIERFDALRWDPIVSAP